MRVVLLAWCASAVHYLDALAAAGVAPLLVVTGEKAPAASPLGRSCARLEVPIESWFDANDPRLVQALNALSPDLLCVAGWPRILREPLRSSARLGVVNFHPSLLPWYRGRNPLFWALLRDESTVGITAHLMTDELDAGPILLKRPVQVAEGDTQLSLADRVDQAGAQLLGELLDLAAAGTFPLGEPPEEDGSYTQPVRAEHGLLDWTWPAADLERLVRAAVGVVDVYTFFRGMKLKLLAARCGSDTADAPAGTVVGLAASGLEVATGKGTLVAVSWRFVDRPHTASELADAIGLTLGSRFTHNPALG